jgi:hypothetical protein
MCSTHTQFKVRTLLDNKYQVDGVKVIRLRAVMHIEAQRFFFFFLGSSGFQRGA